jgi:nitrate/TMAO reductase-like tetraheme cytochrome c subunit
MSVYHYLLEKRSYERIIHELTAIIQNYDELEEINYQNTTDRINLISSDKKKFVEMKKTIEKRKKQCETDMCNECNHEFINDLIDIDPDTSKMVRYCEKCEYVEK